MSATENACGCSSVVERQPSKLDVRGSSPLIRFIILTNSNFQMASNTNFFFRFLAKEKRKSDTSTSGPLEVFIFSSLIRTELSEPRNVFLAPSNAIFYYYAYLELLVFLPFHCSSTLFAIAHRRKSNLNRTLFLSRYYFREDYLSAWKQHVF